MDTVLQLIGRQEPLLQEDMRKYEQELAEKVADSKFLIIGGAGSIGSAVAKEVFRRIRVYASFSLRTCFSAERFNM